MLNVWRNFSWKQNKKNKLNKMNDQIEKMFHEHKYKEVIDQLEDELDYNFVFWKLIPI